MFKVAMDLTSSFLVLSEINSKHVYIIHLNGVSGPECEMMPLNLAFILGGLQTLFLSSLLFHECKSKTNSQIAILFPSMRL